MTRRPIPHALLPALSLLALVVVSRPLAFASQKAPALAPAALRLNELEYLEMPGLNVMLAHDYYPEGHQGGVGIIQNGLRVATNGDIRLDRTPGQWQPVPKVGKRVVDKATGEISLRAEYPDESKNRKGFNPVEYPDLRFAYTVRVRPEGKALPHPRGPRAAAARRVGRPGRLQPGAVPRDPLREDLRDGDAGRHLPAPGRTARGRSTRRGSTRSHRSPPAGGSSSPPSPRSPADGDRGREGRRRSSSSTAAASTTTGGSWCARSSRGARRRAPWSGW